MPGIQLLSKPGVTCPLGPIWSHLDNVFSDQMAAMNHGWHMVTLEIMLQAELKTNKMMCVEVRGHPCFSKDIRK